MAAVSKGNFHATARQHKVLGWVIEIWENGATSPVDVISVESRPTYADKLRELNVLIARRRDAQEERKRWQERERQADEEEARRYRK